jgi:AcrR family transcriptional regulator
MSPDKRAYRSELREAKAELTRKRILRAARRAFAQSGFDKATIREVADLAGVSSPLIYALFKSKEGLLRALIDAALFGGDYQALVARATAEEDPVELLKTAASITRRIYEAELRHMGVIHRPAILSPGLRRLEQRLEKQRYERQEVVIRRLFDGAAVRSGLGYVEARDILWSLTCRELYRLLVLERKWTAHDYEQWLGTLLATTLVDGRHRSFKAGLGRHAHD